MSSLGNDDFGLGLDLQESGREASSSSGGGARSKKRKRVDEGKKKRKKSSKKQRRSISSHEASVHEEEEEAGSERKGRQHGKRGKAKAKARAVGGRKGARGAKVEEGKFRKCGTCKKVKERKTDFHADQGNCKQCCAEIRAFARAADSQGCSDKMQELARTDPVSHSKVLSAWVKERQKASAAGEKIKFAIWEFAVSLQQREGARHESRGRMMWRGYYLSWAQTEEGGSLSEAEARSKWKDFEANRAIARDNKGPHGHQRLKVPMFDDVVEFKEIAQQRELSKREKLNKTTMEENKGGAASLRMKMVVGAAGGAALEVGPKDEWANISSRMKHASFDGDVALQPQAEELALEVQQQKARRSSGASRPPTSASQSQASYESDESGSEDR